MALFIALPPEILVEIMQYLDHLSLLRCSSTCRSLYAVSTSSSRLLYIIALGMSGMIDGGSHIPHLDLLSHVRDLRMGWENIEWRQYHKIAIQEECLAYELVGGVFALSDGIGLKIIYLPSANKEPHTLERRPLGMIIKDFAIDPTQDLVAILEDDLTPVSFGLQRRVHVHIRTISTNERHKLAAQDILSFTISPDPEYGNAMSSALLQLTDDLLAVFMAKGFRRSDAYRVPSTAYQRFLPPKPHIIRPDLHPEQWCSSHILIPPSPSTTHTQKPKLVASLHLPPIRPTYRVQRIGIHSAPYHAHAPKDASFYTSPDAGVQVVTITYAMDETNSPGSSSFSLFVHTRTLLGYTHGRQDSETEGDGNGQALALTRMSEREDVDIQWHQWGETKTRFFPIRTPIHWHRYVHGQRVVCCPSHSNIIDILDFNYNPHFNSVHRLQDLRPAPSLSYPSYLFQEGLVTRLPYYISRRTIQDGFYACMIDEERLIGLKMDDGNGMELHVYSF